MAPDANTTAMPADPAARSAPRVRTSRVTEHERQFREILEHCPAGLNIVDEEGRLFFHSARLREMMGYDEDEILRRSGEPRRQGGRVSLRKDGPRYAEANGRTRSGLARFRDRNPSTVPHRHSHRLLHRWELRQRRPNGLHNCGRRRESSLAP